MSEAKHTQGPWEVAQGTKSDELFVQDVATKGRIARLWNGRSNRDSNAWLIAAAPDLLNAVREARNTLYAIRAHAKERGAPLPEWDQQALDDVFTIIGEAITKAMGEQTV